VGGICMKKEGMEEIYKEKKGWEELIRKERGGSRDGQRTSKMYRLKRYRYAIFEKKIV
jgi:hypothetical protein